jgi:hypothetical protein
MINVWHVIYMMNSPFEGWHMVVTLVWWNKNLDSCPKLYNENFLSDDHWVTQKSWVQDASRRVCPDAKQLFTKHTSKRQVLIFSRETKGKFTTWSLNKGLSLSQWSPL